MVSQRRYSAPSGSTKKKLVELDSNYASALSSISGSLNVSVNYLVNEAISNFLATPDVWPKPETELDDEIQEAIKKLGGK